MCFIPLLGLLYCFSVKRLGLPRFSMLNPLKKSAKDIDYQLVDIRPHRPLQILCLGMTRTGTLSLAAALKQLGYPEIHHGTSTFDQGYSWEWDILNQAADATFPSLPSYRPDEPFTRDDWDRVFGPYDAVTDIASHFGPSLIRAYPEAKVILVERDIDRWEASMDLLWSTTVDAWPQFLIRFIEPLKGGVVGATTAKIITGWCGASDPSQVRGLARDAYRRHYAEIRKMVPEDRLLNLKLGDWESLCSFLGKDVPEVPFPRLNDAESFKRHVNRGLVREFLDIAKNLFVPLVVLFLLACILVAVFGL